MLKKEGYYDIKHTLNKELLLDLFVENMSKELVLLVDEISDNRLDFYYRCQSN
jgi:hypothetical protein